MPDSRTHVLQNANSLILVAYVSLLADATAQAIFRPDARHGLPDIDIIATLFATRVRVTMTENFVFPADVIGEELRFFKKSEKMSSLKKNSKLFNVISAH